MAIDFFHSQITSAGIPVQDLVLKLGMKLLSGEITWAPFRPEQWTDIVCNRDEIRLGGGGAEVVDLYVPGQLITLGLSHDYHFEQPRMSKYMTIVLPRTLEAIKIQKREKEYLN
jgi:hypothetical protein